MRTPQPAGYQPKPYRNQSPWAILVVAFLGSLAGNSLVLGVALASFRQQYSLWPLLLGDTINVLALGYGLWHKQRALTAGVALGYLLTFACSLLVLTP